MNFGVFSSNGECTQLIKIQMNLFLAHFKTIEVLKAKSELAAVDATGNSERK